MSDYRMLTSIRDEINASNYLMKQLIGKMVEILDNLEKRDEYQYFQIKSLTRKSYEKRRCSACNREKVYKGK